MVASSEPSASFVPSERPRVTVAADGTLAAIHEPTRVTIVEIPSCAPFAELGTDPSATSCEVAWVGSPPRLLVLSRYDTHSVVHLVDPFGPRTVSEIRLESPMRLYAAVGNHALAIGALGAAVLAATERNLTPYQFPARTVPAAAGAAGSQFVVATPGAIEEWDPQNRMPKRRLKLPRPASITAVGGSDRVVWVTTQQEPARIDVIPFVNRGQPKAHELPEPISSVASHPRSDVIACIGAQTGRVWVVDLDGRTGLRMVGPQGIDRAEAVGLVLGRVGGVLAAQAQHATTVVTLERETGPAEPARTTVSVPSSARADEETTGPGAVDEGLTTVTLASPALGQVSAPQPPTSPALARTTSVADGGATGPSAAASRQRPVTQPPPTQARAASPPRDIDSGRTRAPTAPPPPHAARSDAGRARPPTPPPLLGALGEDDSRHFAAWVGRVGHPRARTLEPIATLWPDAAAGWRTDLATWAREVSAGGAVEAPRATPIEVVATRFELPTSLEPVLGLLYGMHLLGLDGASPLEVARIAGGWDDALGRGELAACGVVTHAGSRVRLARTIQRVLDELRPEHGTLVGTPGVVSLLGPCVIVSAGPLSIIAEACLPSIGGAILAANRGADPQQVVYEARAYGASPMWRVIPDLLDRVPGDQPLILVADDDVTAERLAVPRLT